MIQILFYVSGFVCIVILTFTGLVWFEQLARNLQWKLRESDPQHALAATLRLIFISLATGEETSDGNVAIHTLELKTTSVYDYLTNPSLQVEVDLAFADFLPRNRPGFRRKEPVS
jgi:hypothetical protein